LAAGSADEHVTVLIDSLINGRMIFGEDHARTRGRRVGAFTKLVECGHDVIIGGANNGGRVREGRIGDAALQFLPPRQRAILLLRDVLGYSAAETADLLGSTPVAVHSGLQRARAAIDAGLPAAALHRPTGDLADLLDRYVRAWHAADIPALVALLRADAQLAMPPTPSWYAGRDAIAAYLRQLFGSPFGRLLRLRPTAANRQPALAVYAPGAAGGELIPFAVKVLTVDGDRISGITGFATPRVFPAFQLPDRLRPGHITDSPHGTALSER